MRGDHLVNDEQAEAKTFSGLSQGVSLKKRIEDYSQHFLGYRCTAESVSQAGKVLRSTNVGRQSEQTKSEQTVEQASQRQADLSSRQTQQNQAGSSENRTSPGRKPLFRS